MRQKKQKDGTLDEAVQASTAAPSVLQRGAPEILPTRRQVERFSPKITGPDGEHRVYVEVGTLDGRIVEVWVDIAHREGSVLRGFAHALARVASQSLQHGMPIEAVIRSLVGSDGGPGGAVVDYDGVAEAASVPDLVGRVLAHVAGVALPPAPGPLS